MIAGEADPVLDVTSSTSKLLGEIYTSNLLRETSTSKQMRELNKMRN